MEEIEIYQNELIFENIIKDEEELLSQRGLLICDLSDVLKKYNIWKLHLPEVMPFYAVKCNDDLTIIKLLNKMGCNFDCASQCEISKILKLGISEDRIIYAHPYKYISYLKFARDNNVYKMTFDAEDELLKIKKYFPTASLILRIRADSKKSFYSLGNKFGCDAELEGRYLLKKASDLNLNVIGVSFHVGTGCQEIEAFERAVKLSSEIIEIGTQLGFHMQILDIGGGFPGNDISKFIDIAQIVKKALSIYLPKNNNIKIIAEPGRYFVESAQTLITDVNSKRIVKINDNIEKIMYFLNDGIYSFFLNVKLGLQDELKFFVYEKIDSINWKKMNIDDNMKYNSTIWGPSCAPTDKIIDEVNLPNLKIGSKLIIVNVGSYTLTAATNFNGFPKPQIKYYLKDSDKKNISNEIKL